jgi:two-component system sensor histidine kinase PilS (NtrC family)
MQSVVEYRPLSRIYSYFTLGLAILFLGFYFFEDKLQWWQATSPKLLPVVLSGYLALALSNVFTSFRHKQTPLDLYLPNIMADILFFGFLLMYLTPAQDDLGIIMLLTVGLGNFLVTQRYGYLLAAMATIMVLSNWFIHPSKEIANKIFSGSFLCALYFLEAFIIQIIRERLSQASSDVQVTKSQLVSASKINDIIIERMQTGVCVATNSGKILTINRAAKERIGNRNKLPEQIFERLQEWFEFGLQNDNTIELESGEGGQLSIMVSFAQIDDRSTLVFIEDKDTVVRRANQFKMASLARMAASIAHEIRNPLSAISHASQLLLDNPQLDPDDQQLCEIIYDHCNRMDDIIKNVLQISRRSSSEPQVIELKSWMETFICELENRYDVAVEIECPACQIRFDPSQLQQVLWNLASNAIRYGMASKKQPLKVSVNQSNQRTRLQVIDHGPGISELEQGFLFEPFHTTSAKGTGLGLYLVKELCEANQAEIRYHNTLHGGACFEILFAPEFQPNKVAQ